jgi:hypothetical protein
VEGGQPGWLGWQGQILQCLECYSKEFGLFFSGEDGTWQSGLGRTT